MNKRKWVKALLYPRVFVIALLVPLCAAALTAVFWNGAEESPLAYGVYVLSFYTLGVAVLHAVKTWPSRIRAVKTAVYDHPLGNRFLTDAAFRTHTTLLFSFAVNVAYVGMHLFSYRRRPSAWFVVMAGYYAILAVMRLLLLRYAAAHPLGTDRSGEWRRASLCAWVLLLVNLALSAAVMMIMFVGRGFAYGPIAIYAVAAYTFYITAQAIVSLVRYRRYRSPVMTMAKVIALCAALVSMLTLETAMFAQFGQDMALADQRLMIALTGAGVSVTVVALSLLMILSAHKEKNRQGDDNDDALAGSV